MQVPSQKMMMIFRHRGQTCVICRMPVWKTVYCLSQQADGFSQSCPLVPYRISLNAWLGPNFQALTQAYTPDSDARICAAHSEIQSAYRMLWSASDVPQNVGVGRLR